ncbi:MAG TPA: DUF4190 domain-containing protein [Pyrinomonadaceae bacterium]|jgi:hypothetical protein
MEKICPNCQSPNPSDAAFCRHCASPLASGAGGQNPFTGQQQNQQNQQHNQQWNSPPPGGQVHGNFAAANAGASGRAIASLALAICTLILCCGPVTGIPGAILGWLEINAIKEGRSSPKGLTMAQIGLWGGIAATVLSIIFYFLFMFMGMLGGGGYRY